MDQSYLEWLSSIPGSGAERARRIAERFPTYEALRGATREEIASVGGLTPRDVEALLGLLGKASEDDSSLFLCPKCGSFVGTDAGTCPFCGVQFDGSSEDRLSEGLDQFLKDEDEPARICLTCGAAMAKDGTACEICGRRYPAEELALLPGLHGPLDEPAPFCSHCGAYLFVDEQDCAICGTSVAPRPEAAPGGKGVVKDFLTRWQRLAEPAPLIAAADRLQEELEHFDRLLEADATLERAWANRAKVLEKLGRPKEAAESLIKAADLNPARDDAYRLEVQNLLRTVGDASVLPPRWKQPPATAPPAPAPRVDPQLVEALAHYDSLLQSDASLTVAWRTKAEILDRLGRTEEARASRERADRLERADEGSLRSAAAGLRSSGLATPGILTAGFTNGRTNGRVNGRVNGHVNGRTNGRVNGLGEGRVNGLTNGAVNGLTFGRGATNGLVNGNGFTNGRRGRQGAPRIPSQPHWSRSVTGIAAVVALMVIVPILASMLSPSPGVPSALIRIDGDFGDWATIPAYSDSSIDQIQNPAVNLLEVKVATQDRDLFVNTRVEGLLFSGGGSNETDSIFVFVDEDANPLTGYPIGDIGADSAVEVYGWSQFGTIEHGVVSMTFNESGVVRSNDWSRFVSGGSADAAFSGSHLEMRMTVRDPSNARILAYAANNLGDRDPADGSVRPSRPTFVVEQSTVAPDVVGNRTPFLRLTMTSLGGVPHLTALNVSRMGTSMDSVDLALYRDDGSGSFDLPDIPLASASMTGARLSLPLDLDLLGTVSFWLVASWTNTTPASTFGLSLSEADSNGTASFRAPELALVYLGAAPSSLQVDGAFADWRGRTAGQDLLGDVTNRTGALTYNANVDLRATAVDVGTNFTGYVRVDGRLLGGQDIPTDRSRTYTSASDTDLDGVPDWVETSLGSDLPRDFNNDNETDDLTGGDVDKDGLVDFPQGGDCWLNTTIPSWFPAPYAGRSVTRYVCPIGMPPQEGVDVVYAYVDRDNSTATGVWSNLDGRTYGFDFAMAVIGRNGIVNSSGLYAFAPERAVPWQLVKGIAVGLDAHRLEFAVDATTLNLSSGFRVVYFASDWRLGSDVALPDGAFGPAPVGAKGLVPGPAPLKAEGDPRALDLDPGETFWLLDADHSSETACTTNKVAGTTPGTGPAVSLTLRAGESACWYLDESTGQTIPGGTWETRFDLLLAHGLAAYGEGSLSTPRYREWSGSFAAEASAQPTAVVPEWVVLAASPLGPEMVLGVLGSNQVLYVQTWDGSSWTSNWNVNLGDSKTRRYDIAYEEQSGDVVVAYGDGTNQLKYRKRVAGTWDSQSQNAGSPLADTPFFVRSGSRPTNNDVIVAAVTNAQTLHALRWNGATNGWGDQIQMTAAVPLSSKDQEVFDVTFERASGDAWVLWGTETSTLRSRRFTTSWQAETTAYTFPDKPLWVVADYDRRTPATTIAVGVTLANNNFEFGARDGGQWVSRPSPVTARDKVQRGIDVAFEATTGRAMFAFNTAANGFQLAWRTWTPGTGFSAITAEPGASGNIAIVQLRPDPRSDDVIALYSDENKALHYRLWDGVGWSALGPAIESTLSIHKDKEAFSFAWTRLVEYDIRFEIWNSTTDTVVEVVGSCLDQSVYGDDVVCSVSGVPGMSLGPDEVVRVRISHSSSGGSFALRYQEGGSGGMGDSRLLVAIPEFGDILFVFVVPVVILALRVRVKRSKMRVADSVPWSGGR